MAMNQERPGRTRRWPVLVGVLLFLVAVVVVLVWRSSSANPDPTSSAGSTQPTSSPSSSGPAPTDLTTTPSPDSSPAPTSAVTDPAPSESSTPFPTTTVAVDAPAAPAAAVEARVTTIEAITGEAVQAGEIGGPALRVTLTISNGSDEDLDLSSAVVNLYYGQAATPATTLAQPGGSPFAGTLRPGRSTSGVYLFTVPLDSRSDVHIELDAQLGGPVVVFSGAAPS